jgi:hypothetical protein
MFSAILAMSPWEILGSLAIFFVLYRAYWEFAVGAARRKMIRENGCKPARVYPHWDPFFGFDLTREILRRFKEGTYLAGLQRRFRMYGNTVQINLFGNWGRVLPKPDERQGMC